MGDEKRQLRPDIKLRGSVMSQPLGMRLGNETPSLKRASASCIVSSAEALCARPENTVPVRVGLLPVSPSRGDEMCKGTALSISPRLARSIQGAQFGPHASHPPTAVRHVFISTCSARRRWPTGTFESGPQLE